MHAIAIAPGDFKQMPPAIQAGLTFLQSQKNPKTADLYRRYLYQWINWCQDQGLDPLNDIDRYHIERWIAEFRQTHKDSTLGSAFTPIRGYYRAAHEEELIRRDPTAYIKLPKIRYPKKPPVDRYDVRKFLLEAKRMSPRHWCLTQLACLCGMRVHEICGLTVEQALHVEQGMRVLHYIGKGNKPAVTPIPYQSVSAVDAQIGERTTGPLLTTKDGSRALSRHGAWTLINTINKRLERRDGIKLNLSPHYLRKIGISEVIAGDGIEAARVFARHEDTATTLRYDINQTELARHPVHGAGSRLAI